MRNGIKLRVYQRVEDHIALLWDSQSLSPEQKSNIDMTLSSMDETEEKKVKFTIAPSEELRMLGLPQSLVMAVINHEDNALLPAKPYIAKIILGTGKILIEEQLRLLPAGTLPSMECDNRFRNVHMYAFNKKEKKWQKCEGDTDEKGRFGLLVVME